MDAALRPAPIGVPGEAYVGGGGVVRGYLDRPGLTAERFVPDPFAAEPGARMYRTGDRLRWKADGNLEFAGRLDEQVKIRGFRIEPGEVESALSAHPGVREARVVAREDEPGETRLVAYVVGDAAADALREHLRRSLPEYMVPAAFVALERIPLTPTGKLDRKALPAPEYAAPEAGYAVPENPVQEVIAGIWAEVLRLERVGARDNFFELGGHSLLATLVMGRVQEIFGTGMPLRTLFEAPTVAELAERVEALRSADAPALPPVVRVGRDHALPLSFGQERLWFLQRLRPESTSYNHPLSLRLGGEMDAAALERALGEIVRRHESLRTTFAETGGVPVQVIAPFDGFSLPVEELPRADDAGVRRIAAEAAARVFDLAAGPLFRARLLRLAARDHLLLLSMHHVFTDGWSIDVLFRELSALYAAYREGGASPLPELAVQYADYGVWQRRHLQGAVLERQLAYWKERLDGAPPLLALPTDRPRPAVQTYRGEHERVELPAALLDRLQALGRGEGATLYMVLLGAFQVLLGRYAGSDDVVVGSPVAGRTRSEVEPLIGFFVNMLVLRTRLGGDPTFRDVLRRVREVTLGAFEHQELPFEKLVAELQPVRSLSHSPLFQVMFTLQNAPRPAGGLAGLRTESVDAHLATTKFELSLTLGADARGLRGSLEYNAELFARGTVRRMIGHLSHVLAQVAGDADTRLSALRLAGADERRRVVEEWNRTDAEYPADRCIHAPFEAQVERTPGAAAVEFEHASLTYRELNARANRLAHHLVRLGVGPEVRVGLCLERSLEMVVSLLAVLKAGGAYVPLDPGYPAERLAFMLADSDVSVLLTQESLRGLLPAREGTRIVSVDGLGADVETGSAANPEHRVTPQSLAYVIYTSGSTGRPKGVMNAHGAVVNRLCWMQAEYGIGGDDVVLQKTPVSFDVSVWELFWPLQRGARLVMARPDGHRDPLYLQSVIERSGVTTVHFVPSMLQQFVETVDAARCATLKRVICSGEALSPALVERFHARFPATAALHNLYGPTEAAVDVSHWACGREDPVEVVPIGRPVWNTRLYVLDPAMEPAPVGVPGELYIGGAQVARGYLNRPSLTAARFVPDPFAAGPGARLYATGDRARWREDGALEYLGRIDQQVKIRGFRIEPGEIEAALLGVDGVRECAVVVREDEPGEKRLVAYVAGAARPGDLLATLKRALPEHMVPGAFVVLDALPLTPNGKLDRKALPAPEYASAGERHVAPRTPVEEVLAGIWAEVLRLERVGAADDFFALGGHSLLATRVVSRIREAFSVELPLRAVFEGPTVAEAAERVEALRRAELPILPPVVPVPRTAAMPLSFAQERLWFLQRLRPESASYNVPAALRLTGALDVGALGRALGEVVRRHEALRTTFEEAGGAPVQMIAPFAGFALPVDDLSGLDEAAREAEVGRRARDDAARPFDLAAGPLFRARLLRLGGEAHVLLIGLHHVVTDGWSMGVLFRELSALYGAYREGRESPLAEPAVQYADYAAWQRGQTAGDALERPLAWWRETLAGAPALLDLPTDHPRPAVQTERGAHERLELPAGLAEWLEALARGEGATLYMVLLGAFQLLLGRYAGSDDVVVGSPIAGRTRRETEELIGFFVNTLVLRTDLSGDPGFRGLLRRVREATLGAYEHQEVPFEKLVEALQPERRLDHAPLFQVMFALAGADGPPLGFPGLRAEGVAADLPATKFDLNLAFSRDARGLRALLQYNADLFEPATIRRMAAHLERVLAQIAANADVRLSELDLLGGAERERVLAAGRGAERGYVTAPVHARFAGHARRAPDAAALLHGPDSLTYGALDRRAEALARRLRELGVGPEVPVGLCMERTPELLVGVLGIWKAGGAYVPLDPGYPAERLGWIVADASLAVIVTAGAAAGALPEHRATLVRSDGLPDADDASPDPVETPVSASNLAYVIYTSGSTGRPKGVLVQHGSLANLLAATREAFGVGPGDVMPALASYAFDIWLFESLLPLTSGAAVRLVGRERVLNVPALLDEAADATLLHAVPALMRQVAAAERESPRLGRLRHAFVGGDRVPADLLAEMRAALPAAETHVFYGPTEGSILASAHPVPADGRVEGHPIGRPFGNVRLYVHDRHGNPQPPGVAGELLVGGAGVARGYLGRRGMTAERFVPDPFSGEPGARLYRTGDRARWLSDGTLEFLGRTDAQVKIRGFRIEPGEVEAALRRDERVRDCVVVAREDAPGDVRLAAYVVGAVDADGLRAHLGRSLPDYMVPGAFVFLGALPVTPNGKVDRAALPAPEYVPGAASPPPRSELEEKVADAWRAVLGVEKIGVHDNFFDLGGTSLLLARVHGRLRELRGDLRVVDLFRYTTVEELAGYLGAGASRDASDLARSRSRAEERRAARRVRG
ncbi:MAG TPA: amino acid adenylation domain-containing protein [Longimicrobium sp.]|nr:amino acid adenylation domain-containing protein [Longimicrobium sp.]